jgi:hypothetical protein
MRHLACRLLVPIAFLISGCAAPTDVPNVVMGSMADEDLDGWSAALDCDDHDATMNPGRDEICMDGVDNDCDGTANDCGLERMIDLSDAHVRLVGERSGDHAGWSVTAAGDVNGDGYDDVAVGAYEDDEGGDYAGAVYLFHGPMSGSINLSRADAKLVGEAAHDHAGWSVAGAGDVNRDGYADLIVGAYGADGAGISSGAAYLVLGPIEGIVDLADADAILVGSDPYDYAGISVAGIGDANGDGYADVAVGAYGKDTTEDGVGAVYIFHGPLLGQRSVDSANGVVQGTGTDDWLGFAVASAGDVDGDGLGDLLIGAPGVSSPDIEAGGGTDAGAAYLFLGPVTGLRTSAGADGTFVGARANDRAGASVGAGDLDGDGYADLVVGGWGADDAYEDSGSVWVFYGPVSGTHPLGEADAIVTGEQFGDNAGISVAVVGDTNSDGRDDLLVGAVNDDSGGPESGAAWLLYGPLEGSVPLAQADVKMVGEVWNDRAGGAVAAAGDMDGDGFGDIIVGAHGNDAGGDNAGAAYIIHGAGW